MANDIKKNKKTNDNIKKSTNNTTKKVASKNSAKTASTAKKTVAKKSAPKAVSKKASAKKSVKKVKQVGVELVDLEQREANLEKTILLNRGDIERADLEEREVSLEKTVKIKPQVVRDLEVKEDELEEIKLGKTTAIKKVDAGEKETPKTLLGLDLTYGDNDDKKNRYKAYAKDSLLFAIIVPIIDFLAMLFIQSYSYWDLTSSVALNYVITLLFDFGIVFVISFIIDMIYGEIQ